MDNKMTAIIGVVIVVLIVGVAAAAFAMNNGDDDSDKSAITGDIVVTAGTTIAKEDFSNALADAGNTFTIGLNESAATPFITFDAASAKEVKDAGKTFALCIDGAVVTISNEELAAISELTGNVTLKASVATEASEVTVKIGSQYSEARAYAFFAVYDKSGNLVPTTGSVSFEIPYKLVKKEKEIADRCVQWNGDLSSCTKAVYKDGKATLTVTAGDEAYLAFMSPEDSAYYPVSFTTLISNKPYTQTLTHRPYSVVTLWDSSTELGILFGLTDNIKFAYAAADYRCLNTDLQPIWNNLACKKTYDSGITASIEEIIAADPDLIIGWASSFVEGAWGVGLPAEWNAKGTAVMACNRPSNCLEDYYTILTNMGTACNMMDKANQLVNEFKDSVQSFKGKLAAAGITEETQKKVIIIESGSSATGTFVYGSAFLTGDLITQIGATNVYDGAMGRLTAEEILKLAVAEDNSSLVDAVILFQEGGDDEKTIKAFKENPVYATFANNVEGHIFVYEFAQIYMGGVLEQDILQQIFSDVYPELVTA